MHTVDAHAQAVYPECCCYPLYNGHTPSVLASFPDAGKIGFFSERLETIGYFCPSWLSFIVSSFNLILELASCHVVRKSYSPLAAHRYCIKSQVKNIQNDVKQIKLVKNCSSTPGVGLTHTGSPQHGERDNDTATC